MKKGISTFLSATLMMLLVLTGILAIPVKAYAATEITFTGKVGENTTAEKLCLSTSGGTVEIKIDSQTDTSEAKFLMKGDKIIADCYRGDDEYWHASKLKADSKSEDADVDKDKKSTVVGRIAKGTTSSKIYLKAKDGTMEIKVDGSTDLSGIRYLVLDQKVEIECARGSDAYMHAISVRPAGSGSSSADIEAKGTEVTGRVEKGTTTSTLKLKTSGGTMDFILDLATDATECRVLIPGQKITAYYYRGSDSWNHISKIVNDSNSRASKANCDANTNVVVSGRVTSETTENTISFETSSGIMEIKLDSETNFSRCPVVVYNTKLKIECERGDDGYYHAKAVILH